MAVPFLLCTISTTFALPNIPLMLQIRCKNNMVTKEFPFGTTLLEILKSYPELKFKYPVVSAKVNNVSEGLRFRAYQNRDVEFVDISDPSGMRVYTRSLCFILYKATQDVFPGSKLFFEHPISHGYYCNFKKHNGSAPDENDVKAILARMKELVDADITFHRIEATTEEAVKIFRENGFPDKVKLLETSGQLYSDYFSLDGTVDNFYGCLAPSTGYIKLFGLEKFGNGMLLLAPDKKDPSRLSTPVAQPRTFEIFSEDLKWNIIMRLSNVGDVNKSIQRGHASELIQVSEALQEKKIVQIAEEIDRRFRKEKDPCKVVLITGPSSSGKTTFCKRLSIQLLACGLRPISFSTDDYFVNRVDTPKLPSGEYDFDNIKAVSSDLLAEHLGRLINGETVEMPEYNFTTGLREYNGKRLKLDDNKILIIEGIHALNPILTSQIPDGMKFKIFISTLTTVSLDCHNWIPTRDHRLLRRIIRDYNKGAFTARETIRQWKHVCDAEDQWINPYQETADMMFNSALNIEFAVLRNHAEPILSSVPRSCPEYSEAHRLSKFIHYFLPVSDKEIPLTSIMREFVGGSSFKY